MGKNNLINFKEYRTDIMMPDELQKLKGWLVWRLEQHPGDKNIMQFNENVTTLLNAQQYRGEEAVEVEPPAKKTASKKQKPAPAATQEQKLEGAPVEAEKSEATYDDVKRAILELSKSKGRDAAVAVLSRHGVAKVPELNEDQYTSVVDMADKTTAGEYDPEGANE
jgi:hypothetical protein